MTDAPACPISDSQLPYRRGHFPGAPPLFPAIPPASDLPSLIRTVNLLRDVLRQLTTSLTVNNVYNPKPPFFKAKGDTNYSHYPAWDQTVTDTSLGFVFHHEKDGTIDRDQRVYIQRTNRVTFHNRMQEDPDFFWSYSRPLDQQLTRPWNPQVAGEPF